MVRWFDAAFDGTGRTAEQASRVEWLCLNNASVTVADGDRGQMLRAFIYKPPSPPGSNKKSLFCRLFDTISKGQSVLLCRQHCRLSICGHFGWVWQIPSEANPNTNRWWDEQACLLLCWFSVRLMLKSLFSFLFWNESQVSWSVSIILSSSALGFIFLGGQPIDIWGGCILRWGNKGLGTARKGRQGFEEGAKSLQTKGANVWRPNYAYFHNVKTKSKWSYFHWPVPESIKLESLSLDLIKHFRATLRLRLCFRMPPQIFVHREDYHFVYISVIGSLP